MSTAANKSETAFTARDFQLLAKAMNCMKTELAVDYARFAEVGGFKNSNSAKASWHALKKKIDRAGEGSVSYAGEPDTTGVPAAAAAPKSKKRKSAADEEGGVEQGEEEPAAPFKKGRKPQAPSAAAKAKAKAEAEAEAVASVEKLDEEMEETEAAIKDEADGEDDDEGQIKEEAAIDE